MYKGVEFLGADHEYMAGVGCYIKDGIILSINDIKLGRLTGEAVNFMSLRGQEKELLKPEIHCTGYLKWSQLLKSFICDEITRNKVMPMQSIYKLANSEKRSLKALVEHLKFWGELGKSERLPISQVDALWDSLYVGGNMTRGEYAERMSKVSYMGELDPCNDIKELYIQYMTSKISDYPNN